MGQIVSDERVSIPHTQSIDLAPVGSDMGDEKEAVVLEMPDISSLDIAEVGATLVAPAPIPKPVDVDLSHMAIESTD